MVQAVLVGKDSVEGSEGVLELDLSLLDARTTPALQRARQPRMSRGVKDGSVADCNCR